MDNWGGEDGSPTANRYYQRRARTKLLAMKWRMLLISSFSSLPNTPERTISAEWRWNSSNGILATVPLTLLATL